MKIKKLVALFTLLLSGWLISNAFNQNNEADKILGVWLTANKDGKIEIFKQLAYWFSFALFAFGSSFGLLL